MDQATEVYYNPTQILKLIPSFDSEICVTTHLNKQILKRSVKRQKKNVFQA